MEGPSIVIATEELKPFLKRRILKASGSAKLPFDEITGSSLKAAKSYGKHLLLFFGHIQLRVHFLMFGSYRIDKPRDQRVPKLQLHYPENDIYFYSCAIKSQPKGFEKNYDTCADLMSPNWSSAKALRKIRAKPERMVCDVLMDQEIFAGLGNIMKNEILFNLKMHPEVKTKELSLTRQKATVSEARTYARQFYRWKKAGVLKRNWQIMRKRHCPTCGLATKKRPTGMLERISHYCSRCQKKA